jgi:hypothetical protein
MSLSIEITFSNPIEVLRENNMSDGRPFDSEAAVVRAVRGRGDRSLTQRSW